MGLRAGQDGSAQPWPLVKRGLLARGPRSRPKVPTDTLSRKAMAALLIQCNEWRIVSDGAILAQLKAQTVLKQMIIDAHKNDEEM